MHSLRAALTSAALLALVLIPVALYLAKRLRPFVCAAEAHLYLCAAALPPVPVACYVLGLPPRPWLVLALLGVIQVGSVSLAVLVLHRLFLQRAEFDGVFPLPDVPEMPSPRDLQRVERGVFPLPEVPGLPTPAELAHAPEASHA